MRSSDDRGPVDELFERLEQIEPPADFVARIVAKAQQGEVARWPRWQRTLFALAYVAALCGLAMLAFLTGSELEHAHLRDLLSLALHDANVIVAAPRVYLVAIVDALPWKYLLAVAADIALLVLATRLVLRVAVPRGAEIAGGILRTGSM